jgi:hypothetical protein
MFLARNKTYRARLRNNLGYVQFVVFLLGIVFIFLGIYGYATPELGMGSNNAVVLTCVGAFILFLALLPPIIEIANVSSTTGIFIAMFFVFTLTIIGLILSGVLEVNI